MSKGQCAFRWGTPEVGVCVSTQTTITDIILICKLHYRLCFFPFSKPGSEIDRQRQRNGCNKMRNTLKSHKQRQEVCPWILGLPGAVTVPYPIGSSQTLSQLLGWPQTLLKIPLRGLQVASQDSIAVIR